MHIQRALAQRQRATQTPQLDDAARRDRARKQRLALQFDVDQGRLAQQDDNPWSHRMALLTDALTLTETDIARASTVVPGPSHPVPATPIHDVTVTTDTPVVVRFTIGETAFRYEDVEDWAERGHQRLAPELVRRAGETSALIPSDTPPDLVVALNNHLDRSLAQLADQLRDGEPITEIRTLADLARPCPTCGGWTDLHGRCQTCAERNAHLQQLMRERTRLLNERAREAEERHRLIERLPIAERRLADLDAEIAAADASAP